MKQLNVFCEGQTEQAFCVQVLQPHLFPDGSGIVHTLAVGQKSHHHIYGTGKRSSYGRLRKFILNTIHQRHQADVFFTSLIDLYALPDDFPGKSQYTHNPADPTRFVLSLEEAFERDINHFRFIPYQQLHEFETMLFAQPESFMISFEKCDQKVKLLDRWSVHFQVSNILTIIVTHPHRMHHRYHPGIRGQKGVGGSRHRPAHRPTNHQIQMPACRWMALQTGGHLLDSLKVARFTLEAAGRDPAGSLTRIRADQPSDQGLRYS